MINPLMITGAFIIEGVERLDRKLTRVAMHLMKWKTGSPKAIHPKNLVKLSLDHELWYDDYLATKPGAKVLDLGAGSGALSLRLALRNFSVTALELDGDNLTLIESFRKNLKDPSLIHLVQHNLEHTPYPVETAAYDFVITCDVVEHLHNRSSHLEEAARALKVGGYLIVAAPNRVTTWKRIRGFFGLSTFADDDHKVEYSREELLAELAGAGFTQPLHESLAVVDAPINGLIDLTAFLSLRLYLWVAQLKIEILRFFPRETTGFRLVFRKA